jgi:hypothetical protein
MLFLHLATEGTNHVIQTREVRFEKKHIAQGCSAVNNTAEGSAATQGIRQGTPRGEREGRTARNTV